MPEIEDVAGEKKEEEVDENDPDQVDQKPDKFAKSRAEWVRGFDHVLPIDYTHGDFKGPITKLISLLEDEKLDPNERDKALNLTPLMKAAHRGYLEAIDVLLDHGADIDLKDNMGFTALHKCWKKHPECKDKLIARGATVFQWPKKRVFHYKFKGHGESYWDEMDDPDAPEDLPKEPLDGKPIPSFLEKSFYENREEIRKQRAEEDAKEAEKLTSITG